MKYHIILLLLTFILCDKLLVSQDNDLDDEGDFVGGVFPTSDSNSDSYNQALQFAQQNYATSCNLSDFQWQSLDGSKNQMVQGMLYYFNVTLKGNDKAEKYEIQVWIQAGTDKNIEITQCNKI